MNRANCVTYNLKCKSLIAVLAKWPIRLLLDFLFCLLSHGCLLDAWLQERRSVPLILCRPRRIPPPCHHLALVMGGMWWQDTLKMILFKGTSFYHCRHLNPDQGIWRATDGHPYFVLYILYTTHTYPLTYQTSIKIFKTGLLCVPICYYGACMCVWIIHVCLCVSKNERNRGHKICSIITRKRLGRRWKASYWFLKGPDSSPECFISSALFILHIKDSIFLWILIAVKALDPCLRAEMRTGAVLTVLREKWDVGGRWPAVVLSNHKQAKPDDIQYILYRNTLKALL